MRRSYIWIIAVVFIFLLASSASGVPSLINYQGRLSDAEGQPVTGQRDVTFSFYNYPATGTPVWTETQSVQVQNGRFNVLLGSVNPVTAAVFSSSEVYLGVKIGTDAEMSPRSRMASVGYAFKAADAETVNGLRANEISAANGGVRGTAYISGTSCQHIATAPSDSYLTLNDYVYIVLDSYGMGYGRLYTTVDCTGNPVGILNATASYWNNSANSGYAASHTPVFKGYAFPGPISLYFRQGFGNGELMLGYTIE